MMMRDAAVIFILSYAVATAASSVAGFAVTVSQHSCHANSQSRTDRSSAWQRHKTRSKHLGLSSLADISDTNDGDDASGDFLQIESLSTNQLLELIELSFLQACVALSESGDVEPLKLFIVAVKTAASKSRDKSVTDIVTKVNEVPPSMKRLDPQELEVRNTWIRAVCLMLGHVDPDNFEFHNDQDVKDNVGETYGPVLGDLVAIKESGLGLNIDSFVETRRSMLGIQTNVLALEENAETNLQLAVVSQTIKVLYNTLVVLEDEKAIEAMTAEWEEESDVGDDEDAKEKKKKSSKKRTSKKKSSGGRGFG